MATLMVLAVLQLGLQATAARRISAEPEHVAQIEQSIMRVTYRGALVLGAVLVLAAPLVQRVLRLDSLLAAVLVGVCVVPLSIMGGQAGILQGERRWWPLSAMYVAAGVPRLVLGTAFMLWRPTVTSAMLGVTIAMFAPIMLGWIALRDERPPGIPAGHDARVGHPGVRAQLPGAAGLLRALQRRHRHRPQRAARPPGRPLRGRADPHEGGAVPAAVRGDHRLPLHGRRRTSGGPP